MKAAFFISLIAAAMAQTVVPAGGAKAAGAAGSCTFDTTTASGDLRCCSVMQPTDAIPQCMSPAASTPGAASVVTTADAQKYCCKITQKCCPNANTAKLQISGCVEAWQQCPTLTAGANTYDFTAVAPAAPNMAGGGVQSLPTAIVNTPEADLKAENLAGGCAVSCGTDQEIATALYGGTAHNAATLVCCAAGTTCAGTAVPYTCTTTDTGENSSWFKRFILWMWLRKIFTGYWGW